MRYPRGGYVDMPEANMNDTTPMYEKASPNSKVIANVRDMTPLIMLENKHIWSRFVKVQCLGKVGYMLKHFVYSPRDW